MSGIRNRSGKEDFGTKYRRWKRNALCPPPGREPWLKDLIMLIAHIFFYPAAYVTLVIQPHLHGSGFGWSPPLAALLWTGLIASGYLVLASAHEACPGPLANLGHLLIMAGFICLIPMSFGFMSVAAAVFILGGFHGLLAIFKPLLFFGFLWYRFYLAYSRG